MRHALLALLALGCSDKSPTDDTGQLPSEEDLDGDGVAADQDCDDGDADTFPGAEELCDGVDNDCDEAVDEEPVDGFEVFTDADGDGYGDEDSATSACEVGEGVAEQAGDCDDSDPAYNPGAEESDCADPNDYNCDGSVGYADEDGDGYAACEECDDSERAVNPSAAELCDGIDNDCDGTADGEDAADAATWYQDSDADGYGDADFTAVSCEAPTGYADNAEDCDDGESAINPDAAELCDGVDQDCDGEIDEDAEDAATWYIDYDGDGYGSDRYTEESCEQPSGYVDNGSDCDDSEALAYEGAAESCDEIDNDCDGDVDEGVEGSWYADSDGDGYGAGSALEACESPGEGWASADGDCDDGDTAYNPGASEGCDGEDYDCDGSVDNDADGDGYADASCGGSDCDDSDVAVLPEAGGGCALGADCAELLADGYSSDGIYTIDPDGYGTGEDPFDVECDMTTDGGGWTLIVDEDYSVDGCPGEWVMDSSEPICRRYTPSGSAPSAEFDTLGVSWSEVRGELIAYQYASANAYWYASGRGVDDYYVDGISITTGTSTRTHLWTYAVGMTGSGLYAYDCPDIGGNSPPSFVGSDYHCETGNPDGTSWGYQWYTDDPMFADAPFQASLSAPTTDPVEVRLICDEEASSLTYSEDVGLGAIALWVR